MFEDRKLDHIGVMCVDSEKNAKWYMEELGYKLLGKFKSSHGDYYTWFVTNGNVTYRDLSEGRHGSGYSGKGRSYRTYLFGY